MLAVFSSSVLGQVLSLRTGTSRGLTLGCSLLIAGMVLLALSLVTATLWLLVAGGLVAGTGQGLSFRAGLGSLTRASAADQRAAVSSAYFVALYAGISLPVIGEGLAATVVGLVPAGVAFAVGVGLLSAVVLVLLLRSRDDVAATRDR